jgi:SAM-dependent methyltransferase
MKTKNGDGAFPILPDEAVQQRYTKASRNREAELCCPVKYSPELLAPIPREVVERDYGCGDPSPFVKQGDTVLDLGSGGGKLCFIASQLVGETGKVIGIDCNRDMLDLARRNQPVFAQNIGYDNVEFRCGLIQDLQLDLELLAVDSAGIELNSVEGLLALRSAEQNLRTDHRLISDNSIDCVISNCVLNLVRPGDRHPLFREIFRVLKVGGRAAISDIVSDEDVPVQMQNDPELWSGCISGAWRDDRFVQEFVDAGFHGAHIANWGQGPWQIVNGIEFRSVTVVAYKSDPSSCLEKNQAVIYRGPFAKVVDDDGIVYQRGQRTAVCGKSFRALAAEPFSRSFIGIEPEIAIPDEMAGPFDCKRPQNRDPKHTKRGLIHDSDTNGDCCSDSGCC